MDTFFSCWPFYVLCFLCPIITGVLKRKTNQNLFLISSSLNLGTKIIPADFLAPVETQNPIADGVHHTVTADDKDQKTITQQFHFISDNLCLRTFSFPFFLIERTSFPCVVLLSSSLQLVFCVFRARDYASVFF